MSESIRSHRDLLVWQRAMELVEECYRLTSQFPKTEMYGLTSQLQRAAVSVPANIAEGHGRKSTGAFLHHLSISYGSLSELETHIEIAQRLKYATPEGGQKPLALVEETRRMLAGLIRSLESRQSSPES
ncbi:MAG: four helix bundle protein [Planctomycetaceae bacterium]|nr:four helix bundle protein [Planctomycetaceae bacterium]